MGSHILGKLRIISQAYFVFESPPILPIICKTGNHFNLKSRLRLKMVYLLSTAVEINCSPFVRFPDLRILDV